MSARPVQILSGVDSIRAADAYRIALAARRDQWPYPHVYPPPNAVDVSEFGSAAIGTAASGAEVVVTHTVPAGKLFYLQRIMFDTFGAGDVAPGDILFTVDRNSPIGVSSSQFMPEHGLVNIGTTLGSHIYGPWKLDRAREFAPNDIVRIKGTNVNVGGGTGGGFFYCGLFGYEVPVLDVRQGK